MYSILKTFKKSAEDLIRTGISVGVVTGGVLAMTTENQANFGPKEALIVLGSAIGSAIWAGIRNYLKNRLK